MSATSLLRDHLQHRQTQGTTHVLLRPGSLEKIRQLGHPPAPAPEPTFVPIPVEPAPAAREILAKPPTPAKAPTARIPVTGSTNAEKIAALTAMAADWQPAHALGTLRQTMVFSVGNPTAKLMLIGEAPGAEEEKLREPFVGPAGQKLTGILKAMGFDRGDVYISNICKFRPAMEDQGNGNRPPSDAEMQACLPFVLTEIDIIRPQVIIALGATASKGLGIEGPVGRLRGRFHDYHGTPAMVTYHPSYILREEKMNGGMDAKRLVWEDMLQVMEKLAMPISDKQRGFFRAK
jgi:uracil-DNA glycosylase family 4